MAKYTNKSNALVVIYAKDGVVRLSKGDVKEVPNCKELDRLVKKGILEAVEEEKPSKAKKTADKESSTQNNQ